MGFGKREQEFLVLVLGDQLDERRERSVGEKYLPLAVYDVFLQVQRDGLRVAEIFHSLGNRDARLLADPEKVVDRRPARENDRAVLQYLYPLTAELFQGDSLELDERVEPDIDAVFEYEFVIGRFFGDGRSRLRY